MCIESKTDQSHSTPATHSKPSHWCSTFDLPIPTVSEIVKKKLGINNPPIGCSTPNVPAPHLYDIFKKVISGQK